MEGKRQHAIMRTFLEKLDFGGKGEEMRKGSTSPDLCETEILNFLKRLEFGRKGKEMEEKRQHAIMRTFLEKLDFGRKGEEMREVSTSPDL